MKRGQTALEFLVLTGFMVFVFTAFFFVIKERTGIATQQERYGEISMLTEIIHEEVSIAHQVKDGYYRIFELPITLQGEQYRVSIDNKNEVTVKLGELEYLLFLPANVTVDGGGTQLQPGYITINKSNQTIVIKSHGSVRP